MAYLCNGIIMKKGIAKQYVRKMKQAKKIRKRLKLNIKKVIIKVQLFIRILDVRVYPLYLINYFKIILLKQYSLSAKLPTIPKIINY